MRISINISTEKEMTYTEGANPKQVILHEGDEKKQGENFNYNLSGLTLNGSIQPLVDMILEWVKKQK